MLTRSAGFSARPYGVRIYWLETVSGVGPCVAAAPSRRQGDSRLTSRRQSPMLVMQCNASRSRPARPSAGSAASRSRRTASRRTSPRSILVRDRSTCPQRCESPPASKSARRSSTCCGNRDTGLAGARVWSRLIPALMSRDLRIETCDTHRRGTLTRTEWRGSAYGVDNRYDQTKDRQRIRIHRCA
jgi:hypothetical protein